MSKAWPVAEAEAKDLLIVAGGIGLAPLRPVVYHALRHRERYGRLLAFLAGEFVQGLQDRAQDARLHARRFDGIAGHARAHALPAGVQLAPAGDTVDVGDDLDCGQGAELGEAQRGRRLDLRRRG